MSIGDAWAAGSWVEASWVTGAWLDTVVEFATVNSLSMTEAQIISGGQTILITLNNDTWVAAGATFNAQRQNIIDGLNASTSQSMGWNNLVRDTEVVTAVVRTSATLVTVTLTAAPTYDITTSEVITVTVPATATVSGLELVAVPTVSVVSDSGAVAFNDQTLYHNDITVRHNDPTLRFQDAAGTRHKRT